MPRESSAATWLNPFVGLIGRERAAPPSAVRRLHGEQLEDRMVLSTAAVPVEAPQGETLAEYLAQEHSMGPAIPADAPAPESAPDMQQVAAVLSPTSIDQLFGVGYGSGAGEGEGSGSGSGGGSGSGSGGGAASGSGSGGNAGSGSGEGEGSGSGSGSGGGSGSGSGGAGSGSPSITNTNVDGNDNGITVTGYIDDDGGINGLTMTLDGGTGTITVNSDGSFSVDITDTLGNTSFTIWVTDAYGNSTGFTFNYSL